MIKLEITNHQIPKHDHREVYCFTINFSHPDADHYTDNTFYFKEHQLDQLVLLLEYLKLYEQQPENWQRENNIYKLPNAYDKLGDCSVFGEDVWDRDITCNSYLASLDGYSVTYFDSYGTEYKVNIIEEV